MATSTEELSITKRKLILHDSLAFLTLTAITAALFAITLFLFHSFEAHRAELAIRWASRGRTAFQAGKPEQAIAAYRTALAYSPDERSYELMLAQALASGGRTEEAYTYFLGLWESRPGDGFINLQLARLVAKKRDTQGAINYYRASIYGTWEGDGVERRRAVRLELAQYLITQHDPSAARAELLIAGGNAPDTPQIALTLAQLLDQAGAPQDALTYYQRALAHDPKNLAALSAAGQLAYSMSDYQTARRFLERAVHEQPLDERNTALLARTQLLLQFSTAESIPIPERVRRILAERPFAKKRLAACNASPLAEPDQLLPLINRWTGLDGTSTRAALLQDPEKQTAAIQLIYDTELKTSQHCEAPTGGDALLLILARASRHEEVSHP
jgi:tetratricopeptide (TPR) repeat protein